jgi:hypothetical protein
MNQNLYPSGNGTCRIQDQLKTANWLCGMMVSILRQYFGSEDRITLEKTSLLWNPDITQSKVQIDALDNAKFGEGAKFPKMLVDLETQSFPKDVLGDLDNFDALSGQRNFSVRTTSAFAIECWSLTKLESWSICDEVRFFLTTYRHEIARHYCLRHLRPIQALKPVKSKMYDDYWVARLIVEFEFDEAWGVLNEQLQVSEFAIKLKEA